MEDEGAPWFRVVVGCWCWRLEWSVFTLFSRKMNFLVNTVYLLVLTDFVVHNEVSSKLDPLAAHRDTDKRPIVKLLFTVVQYSILASQFLYLLVYHHIDFHHAIGPPVLSAFCEIVR
jgi:hypothetical protein